MTSLRSVRKAWLLANRHTVRDYLDTVVLLERLGDDRVPAAFEQFDAIYVQPTGSSPLAEVGSRRRARAVLGATTRSRRARPASMKALRESRALWNRATLDLASDEVLAQILDRGELSAWRALYRLAAEDPALRHRIARLVLTVPLPLPRFWLAALRGLGEPVELSAPVPEYGADGC